MTLNTVQGWKKKHKKIDKGVYSSQKFIIMRFKISSHDGMIEETQL